MRPVLRHLLTSLGLAFAAGTATLAYAGVAISPVVVEMNSPRRAVSVSVHNSGDRPITLQSDVMLWQQLEGSDRYEPTDAFLVVPPIAEIQPGASQVFRLLLRAPVPSPLERTYRLILEDITENQVKDGQAAISFRLTHNLPIMIAPAGKVRNAIRWKPCTSASTSVILPATTAKPGTSLAAEACVRLFNAGNRRVKVQTLTLAGDGWQQELRLKDGINVLAGAEREWRVALSSGHKGVLSGLHVQTALGEKLQAESGGF